MEVFGGHLSEQVVEADLLRLGHHRESGGANFEIHGVALFNMNLLRDGHAFAMRLPERVVNDSGWFPGHYQPLLLRVGEWLHGDKVGAEGGDEKSEVFHGLVEETRCLARSMAKSPAWRVSGEMAGCEPLRVFKRFHVAPSFCRPFSDRER